MLVHAYYEEDSRVRRQAETLVAAGRPVDVFALRRSGDGPEDTIEGVRLHRLPVGRHQGAGIGTYVREYLSFFWRAAWAANRAQRRRHYAVVIVHSLPDFLVFAALPLRLAGVPVILDLHEAMPEFFRMRFPRRAGPIAHPLLLAQERLSIAAASAVITVNDALGDRLLGRGLRPDKLTIVLNTPSTERFDPSSHPARAFREDGILRLVYTGALTPTYELDTVLEAVAGLRRIRPGMPVELAIYGRGDSEPGLRATAADLDIADSVRFAGRVPIEEVPAVIAAADIGLAPTRRDPFTDFSLSTKLFEYAAMGRPVVASSLPTVHRYFAADTIATYRPGDADDMVATILSLVDDPTGREERVRRTSARVRELSWDREAERYLALVEGLASDGLSSSGLPAQIAGEAKES
jgi:glycosyltransferase involved in cell wall biosynthesis